MKKAFLSVSFLLITAMVISSFTSNGKSLIGDTAKTSKYVAGKWTLDKGHSNVKFTVTHMVVSEVDGSFKNFDGSIEGTKPDFSDAVVNFTVDVNSVDTDNENRD